MTDRDIKPGMWEEVCNLVIRPQRCVYDAGSSLGPKTFSLGDKIYKRTDLQLFNSRGLRLECSHFEPHEVQFADVQEVKLPCVIYCHGNCGSRVDALDAVHALLPYNITVFALDFSGSGLSDGEYVSLGFYEKQDVAAVVEYLTSTKKVSKIGLWGRSMGAATSLMYASADRETIAGVVADSPFKSLESLILELVQTHKSWVPKLAVKLAIKALRSSIQNKAKFDLRLLSPIEAVKNLTTPVLFGHAEGDDFIKLSHSQALFEACNSQEKSFVKFDGDHNSERPEYYYNMVTIFFYNTLVGDGKINDKAPDMNVQRTNPRTSNNHLNDDDFHFQQQQLLEEREDKKMLLQAIFNSIQDELIYCEDEETRKECQQRLDEVLQQLADLN